MPTQQTLATYLQGFAKADQAWPAHLADDPGLSWWQALPLQQGFEACWPALASALPQLLLPQEPDISRSERYRQTVLRGQAPAAMPQPLQQPQQLRLWIANHPYGSRPVFATPHRPDFLYLVRALAHRAEPAVIEAGVHAQAISGLIHWGLIHSIGPQSRASLILLHDDPYGSVPASALPLELDEQAWLERSTQLRLEHELTHLTTKRVLGEMRLNLLDELIADAMGQLAALQRFSAEVFLRCLRGRWRSYVDPLSEADADAALALCRLRAQEIEPILNQHVNHLGDGGDIRALLPWLCRQRLDQPIVPMQPAHHLASQGGSI